MQNLIDEAWALSWRLVDAMVREVQANGSTARADRLQWLAHTTWCRYIRRRDRVA